MSYLNIPNISASKKDDLLDKPQTDSRFKALAELLGANNSIYKCSL